MSDPISKPDLVVQEPNLASSLSLPNLYNPANLLPIAEVLGLTEAEKNSAMTFQAAMQVLGPAAGGCLLCPGNQIGIPENDKCPYSAKCVLLRALKAPAGELCPIEAQHIQQKFMGWCSELGQDPASLSESQRSLVGELVWIDVQEHRCSSIVSKGSNARLTELNPKEVHPETLEAIAWERVIHANVQRLDQLHVQRRMLLRDWMLTPEMKARQARWEGKGQGEDISSQQSAKADRLRRLGTGPVVIEAATAEPIS